MREVRNFPLPCRAIRITRSPRGSGFKTFFSSKKLGEEGSGGLAMTDPKCADFQKIFDFWSGSSIYEHFGHS